MSYKALWKNRRNKPHSCSNSNPHCVCGFTTGSGIPSGMVEYGSFRVFYHNGGRMKFLKPPQYKQIMTEDEARQLDIESGRSVPYCRNSVKFVMSRAARKRGYKSNDYFYNRKAKTQR